MYNSSPAAERDNHFVIIFNHIYANQNHDIQELK